MEKFRRAYGAFEKAFRRFEEVRSQNLMSFFREEFYTEIVVKRFEYLYEALWKTVKEFLRVRGIECYSPKSCFSELLKEGVVSYLEEELLSELIYIRNRLVHVYEEETAKMLRDRILQEDIYMFFKELLVKLKT
ncbi:nucleotidyltransferase substrate binding protein [Hydrogenobacter sp. T-2]|uniref:nucleotidyltransferase substrate binding protein n=1 Tax=Pampinifervens diazotrophicum TaxID=1632018 RepID=UPI002B257767|nr:nucleotidyltransferase substrate binding protein [Hydrogenobacter sp. T-2]WPM31764.1 nucleotidyltransferase substrate binding protein [Hydrogenobacter sp. T-2]